MTKRPLPEEFPAYFTKYVDLVPDGDITTILAEQLDVVETFLDELPEDKHDYRYAEGKWTVKEVFGHIVDSERIFGMRAVCVARGETQSLPGFDEDVYVTNADFSSRTLHDLFDEWEALRTANILAVRSLSERALSTTGMANNKPITSNALFWILAGHLTHHLNVLRERY